MIKLEDIKVLEHVETWNTQKRPQKNSNRDENNV